MPSESDLNNADRGLSIDANPEDDPEPWQKVYERIVSLAWPLVVRPLVAHGADNRPYLPYEVERRLKAVAEHLAHAVVPLAEQEAFLKAADRHFPARSLFAEPVRGSQRRQDKKHAAVASPAPERHTRERFASLLGDLLVVAYHRQAADDLALGMPRRMERHPLELRNGAQAWSKHIAARRRNQ